MTLARKHTPKKFKKKVHVFAVSDHDYQELIFRSGLAFHNIARLKGADDPKLKTQVMVAITPKALELEEAEEVMEAAVDNGCHVLKVRYE